jgi:hypothetical protein
VFSVNVRRNSHLNPRPDLPGIYKGEVCRLIDPAGAK